MWSTDRLIAHHKDRNRKHNEMDNLVTVCEKCHVKVHVSELDYKASQHLNRCLDHFIILH
jgi:5-methylcytosine-specific restriction endonuclease McrA